MDGVLMEGIMSMPIGWQIWVYWMMIVNTASIFFLRTPIGKFCLAVWIPNGIMMSLLAEQVGYTRLLGLSHIIWWTPLVLFIALRIKNKAVDFSTWAGRWALVLLVTNALSLVVDYVDVARYIAGDRDDMRPNVEQVDETLDTQPAGLSVENETYPRTA